ncbi:MAG: acyl-CoA dehydratase activase [Chloroflexota bacterium]
MVYCAGIDIGAAFSKAVILSDGQIVSQCVLGSKGNYKDVADEVIGKALTQAGLSMDDIGYVVATGHGAGNVSFADELVTDISCQARSVSHVFPSARTGIDIGDMTTKAFRVDDQGRSVGFVLSGKCAGGSARILQLVARVLRVKLEDIGELSLKSEKKVDFSTGCAVFAETEAVSRVAEGASREDLLAGLHRALAAQIHSLMERVGIEEDCALVGGGAKDIGLVRSLRERLGIELLVPEEPQIVAALGAALIAEDRIPLQHKG